MSAPVAKPRQIPVWFPALALFLLLAAGCAAKETVVLVPDQDGKVGRITVATESGAQTLDQPNTAVKISSAGSDPSAPEPIPPQEIEAAFAEAIEAQPLPPVHFILYFKTDTTQLTEESLAKLPAVVSLLHERYPADIRLVGHTDTTGRDEYNESLSLSRATAVQQALVEAGVPPVLITITYHGENDPLVVTGDNVNEPRNRRVELFVR